MEIWLVRHARENALFITRVALPAGRLLALNETSHLADVALAAVAP